jgi:spore germination cell wall hydrolase CwlJ-like protein
MRILLGLLALVSLLGESSYAKRNYARGRTRRYRVECAKPAAACVGQTNELYCAACVASGEARGNSEKAQKNAIQAMFARMVHKGYPSTMCGVAQKGNGSQFAYRGDHGYVCPKQVDIARKVFAMDMRDMDLKSTNFHARYVHPRWGKILANKTKEDDAHLYYADGSDLKENALQKIADLQHLFGFDRVQVAASYPTGVTR